MADNVVIKSVSTGGGGGIVSATSLGVGEPIITNISGTSDIIHRTIAGNGVIEIRTSSNETVLISATNYPLTFSNLSSAGSSSIVSSVSANKEIIFRKIAGTGQVEVRETPSQIIISGSRTITSLQEAYNNSSNPEIILSSNPGAVSIRNNSTNSLSTMFEVQNNGGGNTYLEVTQQGVGVNPGTRVAPGLYFVGDTNTGITSTSGDSMTLVTNGTASLHITSAQNVGIGTITPDVKMDIDGGLAIRNVSSVVNLTSDNLVVVVGNRSYIRISSDNSIAGSRTFSLTQSLRSGHILVLEWVGGNAGELINNSAQSGGGFHRLQGDWIPLQYDTLTLISNGTDWVELSRGNLPQILDMAVLKVSRTTPYDPPTNGDFYDIEFNNIDIENNTAIVERDDTLVDRILINEAGLYEITYHTDIGSPSVGTSANGPLYFMEGRVTINDVTPIISSSALTSVFRDNAVTGGRYETNLQKTVISNLNQGDFISFQVRKTPSTSLSANPTLYPDSSLTVKRLRPIISNSKRSLKAFNYFAGNLETPNNANWSINSPAPATADTLNNALTVRSFNDTTEEGVGFIVDVPLGSSELVLNFKQRPETSPGTTQTVQWRLHFREIPDNGAVTSWVINSLSPQTVLSNTNFQYRSEQFTLSALGITPGRLYQFELTRQGVAGTDTLTGNLNLIHLRVDFY